MGIVSDRAAHGFAMTNDTDGKHVEPTTVIKFVANHDSYGNPRVVFVGYSGAQVVAMRDGAYTSDPYWTRSHKVYVGTVECTVSQFNNLWLPLTTTSATG